MGNIFAGSEVVEIGIQIEKNGKDFYNTLSQNTKNETCLKMFKYLSAEEEKHIQIFTKMLGGIQNYEPAEAYPGEYVAYMNALASEYIFTKKDKGLQVAKNIKTDNEAVDAGIGFEKDSIIFYEGMKRCVPDFDIKIVDELIRQEEAHLNKLVELKTML